MKKSISHAFRKDIYLLGTDEEGIKYWLEAPSWDCEWYWGFGYVETYTNNSNPGKSKDISSHQHITSLFEKNEVINLNNSFLVQKTFTKEEGKELNQLFTEFYKLSKEADAAHQNNEKLWDKLNKQQIPPVMNRIMEILKPS